MPFQITPLQPHSMHRQRQSVITLAQAGHPSPLSYWWRFFLPLASAVEYTSNAQFSFCTRVRHVQFAVLVFESVFFGPHPRHERAHAQGKTGKSLTRMRSTDGSQTGKKAKSSPAGLVTPAWSGTLLCQVATPAAATPVYAASPSSIRVGVFKTGRTCRAVALRPLHRRPFSIREGGLRREWCPLRSRRRWEVEKGSTRVSGIISESKHPGPAPFGHRGLLLFLRCLAVE